GVPHVVCEEKHMGSRAVVVVCRDEDAARQRFGVVDEGFGVCYTRTGRRFFSNTELERAFLDRMRAALSTADFWSEFESEWFLFDCELMPWSAKAQDLLIQQYAAVGSASRASLKTTANVLRQTIPSLDVTELLDRTLEREVAVNRYVDAYRR